MPSVAHVDTGHDYPSPPRHPQIIHNCYYHNHFSYGDTLVQQWLVQCAHNETGFDYEYFTVDVSIYSALIDFVSLFFFAVTKQTTVSN